MFLIVAGVYIDRADPTQRVVIEKITSRGVTFRRIGASELETVGRPEFEGRFKIGGRFKP